MAGAPSQRHPTLARFLTLPENNAALHAVRELAAFFEGQRDQPPFNPLVLHGPPGAGKSHLASGLARAVGLREGKRVLHRSCRELRLQPVAADRTRMQQEQPAFLKELGEEAAECDLFLLEDLQQLPPAAVATLVGLLDRRLSENRPTVFTALTGPRRLAHRTGKFPSRLTSRLAAGLVVGLEPLGASSRRALLVELAQRRQLALSGEVADWLAANLASSARQLEGAIRQLESLGHLGKKPTLAMVAEHFGPQMEALRPSVDRIVEHVGGYFQIEPGELQSRRRFRNILIPRQVGMYLARQLTGLSLEQIGAYFGGRDHTTVLHACRKVEQAMKKDALLSGAVKHIHAELA